MTSSPRTARSRRKTAKLALAEPAAELLEFLARPWVPQVVFLLGHGEVRFSEISAALPTMSARVLTERLRELCAEGLAVRCVDDLQPSRITYSLTEQGRGLMPALRMLVASTESAGTPGGTR